MGGVIEAGRMPQRASGGLYEPQVVVSVDADGNLPGIAYPLANNVAIGANTGTAPVARVARGVYLWDAQFAGAGPLKLQALGADGATWRDVASLNASGAFAGEIRIGAGASLRLFSATALTGVYAVVS